MRRSFFCLAVIVLATGMTAQFVTFGPSEIDAQESQVAPKQEPNGERPVIPASTEVEALVEFVKTLKTTRPGQPGIDHDKTPAAIRKACERILELEKDEESAAHALARRELLSFRISDLAEAHEVDADERKQLARDVLQVWKDSKRTAADVELATTLSTTFEDIAPSDEAAALYQSLGELFAENPSKDISRRGEYLLGASRRLGILGKPLELSGQTVAGEQFDLGSLKGNIVLVEFWATWCTHCQEELPALRQTYQTYHDQGFEIVGISVDDDRDALSGFLKKQRLPWVNLHDEDSGSEHPAAIRYGITAYPTSFLVDREGRVLATDLRGRKLSRKLAELCGGGGVHADSYPVFHIGDVIDKMTSAGSRLYKAGKTKGDRDLRKQLHRRSVELDLAEPSDELVSDRDLYRSACDSVYIVCSLYKANGRDEWQTSLATAFAVTRDGVLTTSCHVFDNKDEADAIVVMDRHQNVYPVTELLAANRKADTCLFRIEASETKPLALVDGATPGTPVRVLGHPGDSFYYLSSGLVANYEKGHDGITWLNTTADFGQGASGGPVLDEYGNVIGQVSRTYTLYAGGPATRGRPRRVANQAPTEKRDKEPDPRNDPDDDVADPQMVFKCCVPVKTLRSLIQAKKAALVPKQGDAR